MKRTGAVVVSSVLALLGACSSERVYSEDCDGSSCEEGGAAGESGVTEPESGGASGAGGSAQSGGDAGTGIGGNDEPGVPLEVVSVSPEDGESGVATEDTSVAATFSQTLDAATLTSETFTVSVRGKAIDGELVVDGATATITPSAPLSLLSEYQVSLAGDITDEQGNGLSSPPYTWSFSTADGSWKDVQAIELDPNNARESQVAVDALGNGIAVWRAQNQSGAFDVWANRYDLETGWAEPVMLDVEEGSTYFPQIAMDSRGNAVAVWHQLESGALFEVWAATFSPEDGWAEAYNVKPATEHSTGFDTAVVAFDDTGHAIVAWTETDGITGSSARVWANRLTWANRDSISAGWGNADTIDDELVRNRSKPRVQLDAAGNAFVTWHQTENTGSSVWSARFDIESGWGEAAELDHDETWVYNEALASNRRGEAVALTATGEQLRATRFVPEQGWEEEPTPVGEPGEALGPGAAMDEQGNIIATWTAGGDLWASRYVPGDGWGDPEKLDADGANGASPVIAIDPNGNAIVVWTQAEGVSFNRYTVADGWAGPKWLVADDNPQGFALSIAASASGRALISWQFDFSIGGAAFR
jgi:hypothetical protein